MATVRQEIAFKEVMEKRGNVSKAMLKAGYPPATAKNPANLTKSKSWQELMDKYLPEEKLLKVGQDGLKAVNDKGKKDFSVRHKYYETGLKLRNKLKDNSQENKTLIVMVSNESASRYKLADNKTVEVISQEHKKIKSQDDNTLNI